jgi:acyl carrier protein
MEKNVDQIIEKLKVQIIAALNLEEITPQDIDSDAPLFGDGLGLDSIDALELVILLEREYGIRMEDPKANKEVFRSVRTIAEYIVSKS